VRQIGDISICRYYETGSFVAIRAYPDIVFSVFKTDSEAVDYCLDRFQPQLKIFKMPIDYKKYPKNWLTEIRRDILIRAQNKCECCGVPNYAVGSRDGNVFEPVCGTIHLDMAGNGELSFKEAKEVSEHFTAFFNQKHIVVVLTISHTDHNIQNNNYNNLKALCQKCHNSHDAKYRAQNRKKGGLK
jgi:uncharacterized Zn finger protein (UPF0148 family)